MLVRVSMGLSFHDEESMVEAATTLRFQVASDDSRDESNRDISSIVHDSEEGNDDDVINICIQHGKDSDSDTHSYNSTVQV